MDRDGLKVTGSGAVPPGLPGNNRFRKQISGLFHFFGARPWLQTFMLWSGPLVFLALFYFFPLFSILRLSYGRVEGGLLTPFREAISSPAVISVLSFTTWQATLSTLFTLMLGLPAAYLFARNIERARNRLMETGDRYLRERAVDLQEQTYVG